MFGPFQMVVAWVEDAVIASQAVAMPQMTSFDVNFRVFIDGVSRAT
jgi:hypothetical protein